MSDTPDKPDLVIDEDWKSRVQAEKAAASAKASPETARQEPRPPDAPTKPAAAKPREEPQPPPASLLLLISTLATQALMALSPEPRPDEPEPKAHLGEAKHLIDMLGVLEEKTRGNLTEQEATALESVLHQLRMAFIQARA